MSENFRHFDEKLLTRLIKELTHSGKNFLEENTVKRVKQLCRSNQNHIQFVFNSLMKHLKRKHSEIRLSSFQLMDVLFLRSHQFRLLLLEDIAIIMELCLGGDEGRKPLPPPKQAASLLRETFKSSIERWHTKFAPGYHRLNQLPSFLKRAYRLDVSSENSAVGGSMQRTAAPSNTAVTPTVDTSGAACNLRLVEMVNTEVRSSCDDIRRVLDQSDRCFSLLVPDLFDDVIGSRQSPVSDSFPADAESGTQGDDGDDEGGDNDDDDGDNDDDILFEHRAHGIPSARQYIQINVNRSNISVVDVTKDNCDTVNSLKELINTVSRDLLPKVERWVAIATDAHADGAIMAHLTRMRDVLNAVVSRFNCLRLRGESGGSRLQECDSDSEDEDFIEVPCEPRLDKVVNSNSVSAISGDEKKAPHEVVTFDRTEFAANGVRVDASSNTDSASQSAADVSSCDQLLSAVGDSCDVRLEGCWKLGPSSSVSDCRQRRESVWSGSSAADMASSEAFTQVTSVVNVARLWRPVKHKCGALLPSGRLCPRADRHRCPLHGPIVARDQTGAPLDERHRREELQERVRRADDWQDARLLAQLRASTGVDLRVGGGRRGGGRRGGGGGNQLTNLKRSTVRQRIVGKLTKKHRPSHS